MTSRSTLPAALLVLAIATTAQAGQSQTTKPLPYIVAPTLNRPATIGRATAEKTALQKVPGGTIKSGELEHEHGLDIWSFDIAQPHSRNIKEVQVDAASGKVVGVTTETPKGQAREAAKERAEKAANRNKDESKQH
jgi:hypothetical protein